MQPQLGMFIDRPSSFKIDAKELLSTNGTIYKQFSLSNSHLHSTISCAVTALYIANKTDQKSPLRILPKMFLHSYISLP